MHSSHVGFYVSLPVMASVLDVLQNEERQQAREAHRPQVRHLAAATTVTGRGSEHAFRGGGDKRGFSSAGGSMQVQHTGSTSGRSTNSKKKDRDAGEGDDGDDGGL